MSDVLTVDEAITAVMRDVTYLGKNQKNSHQGFNFRGIDDVMNICGPAMRKHGLKAFPRVVGDPHVSSRPTKSGTAKTVDLVVDVVWRGPAGDEIVSRVAAESFDSGDKATAKAMSVALRTAYLQTLCLPTCEPDPDSYSYEITGEGEREEFLARIAGIDDVGALRRLQHEAKRVGAVDEWIKRGKELQEAK